MEVGSDTFPRDEVTGLAAFEHLDPISTVSTLSFMQEPPAPAPRVFTPPPPPPSMSRASTVPGRGGLPRTGVSLPPPPPAAARTFSRPASPSSATGSLPPPAPLPAEMRRAERPDDTETMDIDGAVSANDPGWDDPDDAATRVQAASPAAELHMDWDDDEPPTQMRGEGGHHNTSVPMDWDDENLDTRLRDIDDGMNDVADTSAYQPAGDSGRPSPFPTRPSVAGYAPAAAQIESVVGAPSPFAAAETAWGQDLRGTDRRSQLWIAAGALCIVALAFGVRAMFAKEAPGLVTLATVPSDARVLVDGKPVSGTSSPFSAADLKPGVAHELLVQKDGFVEQHTTFTLTEGEAKTLPTIELASAESKSGFAIDSVPGGAQIQVDGTPTGLSTPARVTHVASGLHKVELVRDGFATYEVQVFVPETQVLELPAATLVASHGTAAMKADSKQVEEAAAVAVSPAAQAREDAARELRHQRRAAAHSTAAGSHHVAMAPAPRVAKAAAPKPIKAPVTKAAAGKGVLRVNSRPWAQVFVDGRMVGNTPQMAIQLTPGNHTIKLTNPQMGLHKSFTVKATAGKTETKVLNLID